VKNDDVMDLIVVFCILFVFMLVLYCFCVATEFSVNKDLYKSVNWAALAAPASKSSPTRTLRRLGGVISFRDGNPPPPDRTCCSSNLSSEQFICRSAPQFTLHIIIIYYATWAAHTHTHTHNSIQPHTSTYTKLHTKVYKNTEKD